MTKISAVFLQTRVWFFRQKLQYANACILPGIVDLMDDLMGPVDKAEGSRDICLGRQ